MGGRRSRQTRRREEGEKMANKDAVSVARFWRDVELKSLYSFPSTKTHCNLNKQLPTLLCKQEKGQRSDNQQA